MADSPKRLISTQQKGQDILMEGHDSNHRKHDGPAFRAGWENIWGKKVPDDLKKRLLGDKCLPPNSEREIQAAIDAAGERKDWNEVNRLMVISVEDWEKENGQEQT